MQRTAITTIIYIFSVVIPIQSHLTTYTYNYDSFGEIFPQGDVGYNEFHVYKYADIDTIFDTEYKGTNIGGAFLVQGSSYIQNLEYEGYVANITATFYCGSTEAEQGGSSLFIGVYYPVFKDGDDILICQEKGWHYNYTWTPPRGAKYQNFKLYIRAKDATIDRPYGFDELRITASTTPPPTQKPTTKRTTTTMSPQLLQRDNTSSNAP